MDLTNTQKSWLLALGLVLTSIVSFILINRYTAWEQCQNNQPTINRLSAAADSLAVSLIKMESVLEDQSVELEIKEALIEEKNEEIGFLSYQFKKIEKRQSNESSELIRLRKQLASARRQLHKAQQNFVTMRSTQGLIYKIQIGLLDQAILPPLPGGPETFLIEEIAGVQKYVFGHFEAHADALEFRDLFRKLGVQDAWVVPYIDAQRVDQATASAYLEQGQSDASIISSR
ncbi:MAG: hypothetical protein AAFN10_06500 [Bacteroidota bacterium]